MVPVSVEVVVPVSVQIRELLIREPRPPLPVNPETSRLSLLPREPTDHQVSSEILSGPPMHGEEFYQLSSERRTFVGFAAAIRLAFKSWVAEIGAVAVREKTGPGYC